MQYRHGMQAVPMLDLVAQHAPLLEDLQRAAGRVIASGKFLLGEEVAAFEQAIASTSGVAHAVGVSSGTDALLALLMACGVGPGDEVVTTPYSFFATAAVIARLGARPQFADVDADTMNMDPVAAAARIGRRTKAVLVVHLFGRVAGSSGLTEACRKAGIPLLEDAAQAIGAWSDEDGTRRAIGTLDRGAAISFFPSKNLGGFGDGGAVITNDAELAARVRLLRNQGASRRLVHTAVGGNFRLDELQAALLRVKLPHLPGWTTARVRIASFYRERLARLPIALPPADAGCVWNQFVVRVPADRREAIVEALRKDDVATAIYYPVPLHLQPALGSFGYRRGDLPRAERAAQEALALPIFPGLDEERAERVTAALASCFG
jgi:dTDP-4-amino-4,6-dideoxygalactose transaminase